jgi:TRAP-type C4-dicarboxylate transport system substrate-binding protein
MWDGFWILANRANWDALPKDIQEIVAKNINVAGVNQREDVAKLNATLREQLTSRGMKFNDVDATKFRDKLRAAGFYAEWKGKFGEKAWNLLEGSVGKLS